MLQQILKDMYVDPDILEELSEDQKQILFFKMREEQIRRWNVGEEKSLQEQKLKPVIKKKSAKNVRFYCDADLNLIIDYASEPDPDDVKRKQEEEVLRKAEEQARKEAEPRRKKLEEIEAKRQQEVKQKEEMERLKKGMEERKEEEKRRREEEANFQKEKDEAEKKLLEKKNRTKEAERGKEEEERRNEETKREKEEENRLKIEKAREAELAEEESKRKEEIYQSMKMEQEETRKHEEEESKRLDDEWREREEKAKVADKQRRDSFTNSKREIERMRRLSKERLELQKFKKIDKPDVKTKTNNEFINITEHIETTTSIMTMPTSPNATSTFPLTAKKGYSEKQSSTTSTSSKARSLPFKRPPLPSGTDGLSRPTISTPVRVTSTRDEVDTTHIKKELHRPSRPPPPPSLLRGKPNSEETVERPEDATLKRDAKPNRPARPKSKNEVATWYREVEYARLSGLDDEKRPMEWLHGVITRQESEKLLSSKKQGSYLVRLSERVWGYTISFKDAGRCKHFLIDTAQGGYQFFGMDQIVHNSLNELIEYHKKKYISGLGEELLLYPCGQENTPPDYEDLFPPDYEDLFDDK